MKKSTFYLCILLIFPLLFSCKKDDDTTNYEELNGIWYTVSENGSLIDENDSSSMEFSPIGITVREYHRESRSEDWKLNAYENDPSLGYSMIIHLKSKYNNYFTTEDVASQGALDQLNNQLKNGLITQEMYDAYLAMITIQTEIHYKLVSQEELELKIIIDDRDEAGMPTGEKEENILILAKVTE
ncbi:hypothetical protein N9251_00840 [Gammaproteobacteria bacterium]|nr:hypothetical protein [Gammaproteobacteria bacterium]